MHYVSDQPERRTVGADFTDWHNLAVNWRPGRVSFAWDGVRYASIPMPAPPSEPMELHLKCTPIENNPPTEPGAMQVGWVLIYE